MNLTMEKIKPEQVEVSKPKSIWFGEFDETGVGPDLTLEWDSVDPDLHARLEELVAAVAAEPDWYDPERGIPDA